MRSQHLRGEDKKTKFSETAPRNHEDKENLREKDPNTLDMNDRETRRIVRGFQNESKVLAVSNSNTPHKMRETKSQKQISSVLGNNTDFLNSKRDSSGCKNLQERLSQVYFLFKTHQLN